MYIETMPCGCPATKVTKMNIKEATRLLTSNNSFLFMGPDPHGEITVNTIFYNEENKTCYWLSLTDDGEGKVTVTGEKQTDLLTGAQALVEIFQAEIALSYGHGKPA